MLRDIQARFLRDALAEDTVEVAYVVPGNLSAARRIGVYRTNILASLTGALGDIYPVVKRLVGDAFFQHAAAQYVRVTPSRSGDLNRFGDAWPQFLADYPYGQDHPYLPDVARLEWAWHCAFHAADGAAFNVARLAEVPAEQHGALRFKLQAGMAVIDSRYPILDLWRANQPDADVGEEVAGSDWTNSMQPSSTLVYRDGYAVMLRALLPAERAFIVALARGSTLAEAIEPAFAIDANFDLQGFLLSLVQYGVITHLELLT